MTFRTEIVSQDGHIQIAVIIPVFIARVARSIADHVKITIFLAGIVDLAAVVNGIRDPVIVIIGIVILLIGSFFTVMRSFMPNFSREVMLDRLRERNPELTEEELQQLLANRPGFGIFGNVNWILLAIGGIVTVIGFVLSPKQKQEAPGFKIGY